MLSFGRSGSSCEVTLLATLPAIADLKEKLARRLTVVGEEAAARGGGWRCAGGC